MLESVRCYLCGSSNSRFLVSAEDDLTGKPGRFQFVTCNSCGLAYQNPRVTLERIGEFYDKQYIAHRKTRPWGLLAPFFDRAMNKLDADKDRSISRYVTLDRSKRVLDVGCATGTFLQRLRTVHGARVSGVDFKDLFIQPDARGCGIPLRALLRGTPRGPVVRPGHDVALPRARLRPSPQPADTTVS